LATTTTNHHHSCGYDAIVVGARCGGAPTAMLMVRKGYRVLLLDRAAFPSDIALGHFIHKNEPKRLARGDCLTGLSPRISRQFRQ
jgi:choline dehydrogenase-like flavoprotein